MLQIMEKTNCPDILDKISHTGTKMWGASNQHHTYIVLLPVNPNMILRSLTPNTVK